MFELDRRLAADSVAVGQFPLSLLLLSRDSNYPWFILVPQRPGVREIHELAESDQCQLLRESRCLALALTAVFRADKINVAALGNVVPQLHIHHIARRFTDPSWPRPVWGAVPAIDYAPGQLATIFERMTVALADTGFVPWSPGPRGDVGTD